MKLHKNIFPYITLVSLLLGSLTSLAVHHTVESFPKEYTGMQEEWKRDQRENNSTVICQAISEECGWFPYTTKKGFPFSSGSEELKINPFSYSQKYDPIGFLLNVFVYTGLYALIISVVSTTLYKRRGVNSIVVCMALSLVYYA